MKKSKQITDISNRELKVGDQVFILDVPHTKSEIVDIVNSSFVGEILSNNGDLMTIKIGNHIYDYPVKWAKHLSKIDPNMDIDDLIIHIAQDIESRQLMNEAEILNEMLNK